MLRFILRKIFYGLLVLAGIIVVVFFLFMALPGDPAKITLGDRAGDASYSALNKELGLDQSKLTQLKLYLNDVSPFSLHDNTKENSEKYHYVKIFSVGGKSFVLKFPYLRRSYIDQKSVSGKLLTVLPNTLVLAFAAILISVFFGILFGIFAALKHHTWMDNSVLFLTVLGISVPSFFSAILFQWFFAYVIGNFTGLPMFGSLYEMNNSGEDVLVLSNLILPAIALGIRPIAIITQLTRSSMLDVMNADYVRTAKAKGLSPQKIIFKHTLRNALNPVLTAVSGWFAEMLAGAFFIEMIFGWNGIGKLTVDALNKNDFPVVMGSVLFTATIFVVLNIFTDVMYGVLDPRMRKMKN